VVSFATNGKIEVLMIERAGLQRPLVVLVTLQRGGVEMAPRFRTTIAAW
jgi:hypothetical protein